MEERVQKTMVQATDHPKGERLEAEGLSGGADFYGDNRRQDCGVAGR